MNPYTVMQTALVYASQASPTRCNASRYTWPWEIYMEPGRNELVEQGFYGDDHSIEARTD